LGLALRADPHLRRHRGTGVPVRRWLCDGAGHPERHVSGYHLPGPPPRPWTPATAEQPPARCRS